METDRVAQITGVKEIIPVVPTSNLLETIEYYVSHLGASEPWNFGEPPYYGGVRLAGKSIHFINVSAASGGELYVWVEDVESVLGLVQATGAKITSPLGKRPYGMRDFSVTDLDGMKVTFGEESD